MKDPKIKALIQLLDDPDQMVYDSVSKQLIENGQESLPYLEASLGLYDSELVNHRIKSLIELLQNQSFFSEFEKWLLSDDQPLIYGLFYVNALFYPDTKFEDFRADFDKLRKLVWLELNDNLTGFEAINVLNNLFYNIKTFSIESSADVNLSLHFPESFFLSGSGAPFPFIGIYSVLAQSLNLPVFPVYLPGLLLLSYENKDVAKEAYGKNANDVLFYINPYDKGAFLGRKALNFVVDKKEIPAKSKHFKSISNFDFIYIYLKYLKQLPNMSIERGQDILRLLEIMDENTPKS